MSDTKWTGIEMFVNKINKLGAVLLLCSVSFLACVPPTPGNQPPVSPNDFIIRTVLFFLAIFGVYWALVLRPMQLKEVEKEKLIEGLKRGDDVVTSGGILGKVVTASKEEIVVEIAANVRIRVQPEHVQIKPKKEATEESSGDKPNKK